MIILSLGRGPDLKYITVPIFFSKLVLSRVFRIFNKILCIRIGKSTYVFEPFVPWINF